MSTPQQRPLLPAGAMDADKSARLPFPFPFCVPTSSPSSVFPMFPPAFQLYANLLQQQLLQQTQQSPSLRTDLSPGLSDQGSSRGESPSVRKLQLDDDGCPICPICGDKLNENDWSEHVEAEKRKLSSLISNVRETKPLSQSNSDAAICNNALEQTRRKRELELLRIRNNQHKRLQLKRGTTALLRDSLTPFSRQSNDETGSSGSPEVKKEDTDIFGNIKCFACLRPMEYGIVSASFEQPRCQECFDSLRIQTGIIPASIASVLDVSLQSTSPTTDSSPPEKKIRLH